MDEEIHKCVICGDNSDESHHIFPQAYGGAVNSPQVWLCSSCHSRIHLIAGRIYKGKSYDVNQQWFNRARPLINRIVQAKIAAETADLSNVPGSIILKLPKGKIKLIHRRKLDLGFRNLESYLMALIDRDLGK